MTKLSKAISDGLHSSRPLEWRLWLSTQDRNQESLKALDRVEAAANQKGQDQLVRAAQLARAGSKRCRPEEKLRLLRKTFEALEAGVADGVHGLAGFALRLAQASKSAAPFLYQQSLEAQPGWEQDFLTSLEVSPLAGLAQLQQPGEWTLQRGARVALDHSSKPLEALEKLKTLEPHQAFQAHQQLSAVTSDQKALARHTLEQLQSSYSPLEFSQRPFRENLGAPDWLADWTLEQLPDSPWYPFWKEAPETRVEILEKLQAGRTLSVPDALEVVAPHLEQSPHLLGSVKKVASSQSQEDWRQALGLLEKLPEESLQAGIDHLLSRGPGALERALIAAAAPGPTLLGVAEALLEMAPDSRLKAFLATLPEGSSEGTLARGARILREEQPEDSLTTLALLACRTSDASERISQKHAILCHGLAAVHRQATCDWQAKSVELVWELAHLKAPTNQLWLGTAAAHHGLRLLAQGLPQSEAEFAQFGRTLLQSQWMIPEWAKPLEKAVAKGLEESSDAIVAELLKSLPPEPRASLDRLCEVLTSLPFQARASRSSLGLEISESYIELGGFELPVVDREPSRELNLDPAGAIQQTTRTPLVPRHDYTQEERELKVITRWDESYQSGQVTVYNPRSGQFVTQDSYRDGVAAGYDPETGKVKVESSYKDGVALAYHPEKATFELRTSYKSGLAALRNPVTGQVKFREAYNSGIGAAVNPYTGEEKWVDSYQSGVAGYYDLNREGFDFRNSYQSGLAVATNDPGHPTLMSSYSWSMDFE